MKKLLTLLGLLVTTTVFAAAPVIWQSSQFSKFLTTSGFKLNDDKQYLSLSVDPSAGAGISAPIGSIGVRNNAGSGEGWFKTGAADTSWSNFLTGSSGWSLLGNAGTNAAANYLGTSDAVDLVLRTNATERFRITSGGSLDTTLGLGVLKADTSGVLSSILGTSNQVLGVNNAGNDTEFKSISGTANRLGVTHAANSITLDVDATLLPSPGAGDANEVLIASGANAAGWGLVSNANVAAAGVANIARDKLASGTASHVLINDGSGVMSSEARLSLSRTAAGAANNVLIGAGAGSDPAYGLIANANIDAAAAIARSKVAAGTADHVVINDGSGNLSSEARLSLSRFATGTSGYPLLGGGAGSSAYGQLDLTVGVTGVLPVANGGTNLNAVGTANYLFGTNNAGNAYEHKAVTATAAGALTAPGALRSNTSLVLEDPGAGSNTTTIQAGTVGTSYTVTLPNNVCSSGQVWADNGSGVMSCTTVSTAQRAQMRCNAAIGHGSTNNRIVRFNTCTSSGDISYTPSSTNGDSFTTGSDGLYSISYTIRYGAGAAEICGISLNSTQLTTDINAINTSDRIWASITAGNNDTADGAVTLYLPSGSVIRVHDRGATLNAENTEQFFTMTKVSN